MKFTAKYVPDIWVTPCLAAFIDEDYLAGPYGHTRSYKIYALDFAVLCWNVGIRVKIYNDNVQDINPSY